MEMCLDGLSNWSLRCVGSCLGFKKFWIWFVKLQLFNCPSEAEALKPIKINGQEYTSFNMCSQGGKC